MGRRVKRRLDQCVKERREEGVRGGGGDGGGHTGKFWRIKSEEKKKR